MIAAWHLVWIVPGSMVIGFVLAGLLSANGRDD